MYGPGRTIVIYTAASAAGFSLSSLAGLFLGGLPFIGGAHFTPIVNKPEVAILGLGRGAQKPVVREGKVEARTLLPLAIPYDHRVIDRGSAARFTVAPSAV